MKKILILFITFLITHNFKQLSAAALGKPNPVEKNDVATKKLEELFSKRNYYDPIDKEKVEELLQQGANPDAFINYHQLLSNYDILKLFLDYGADPNMPNQWGLNPLTELTQSGEKNLVKLLLDYSANPNFQILSGESRSTMGSWEEIGSTALMSAAGNRQNEIVKLLLDPKYKTDVNLKKATGETALFYAIDRVSYLKRFLNSIKDPKRISNVKEDINSLYEIIKLLLEAGSIVHDEKNSLQRINEDPNLKKIYDDYKKQIRENIFDLARLPKEIAQICAEYL